MGECSAPLSGSTCPSRVRSTPSRTAAVHSNASFLVEKSRQACPRIKHGGGHGGHGHNEHANKKEAPSVLRPPAAPAARTHVVVVRRAGPHARRRTIHRLAPVLLRHRIASRPPCRAAPAPLRGLPVPAAARDGAPGDRRRRDSLARASRRGRARAPTPNYSLL